MTDQEKPPQPCEPIELESPNSVPPQLEAFAARGYERVNRHAAEPGERGAHELTEFQIETLQPEAMNVLQLNRVVRTLRELLYQARLSPPPPQPPGVGEDVLTEAQIEGAVADEREWLSMHVQPCDCCPCLSARAFLSLRAEVQDRDKSLLYFKAESDRLRAEVQRLTALAKDCEQEHPPEPEYLRWQETEPALRAEVQKLREEKDELRATLKLEAVVSNSRWDTIIDVSRRLTAAEERLSERDAEAQARTVSHVRLMREINDACPESGIGSDLMVTTRVLLKEFLALRTRLSTLEGALEESLPLIHSVRLRFSFDDHDESVTQKWEAMIRAALNSSGEGEK